MGAYECVNERLIETRGPEVHHHHRKGGWTQPRSRAVSASGALALGVLLVAASGPDAIFAPAMAQPAPVPVAAPEAPAIPPERLLREIAPADLPRLSPGLQGPPLTATPIAPGAPAVTIVGASVTGHTAVPQTRLEQHFTGLVGREVSQEEIEAARIAVLTEYRSAGFAFTSVIVTGEAAPGGFALRFAVQEGRIAQVRLSGPIGPAGVQVMRFLRGAVSEGAANIRQIERALLLAGDVPGVTVRGVLRPLEGGQAGELELVADVTRRRFSGLTTVDNRGFRLTGPVQFLALAQANSFTSLGERTEAAFFTSALGESMFGQMTSEFFVGGSGLRVRLYAGAGQTSPSGALADIGYAGFTVTAGAALSYPIIRSRSANLTAGIQFDIFDNTVDTGTTQAVRASHDSLRIIRAGLDGQFRDTVLPGPGAATTTGQLRVHQGILAFGATRGGSIPGPSRRGSNARFTKVTGEFQRTQPLFSLGENATVSVQGTLSGQWSNDILPAAEKYFLGGARLGRGFYAGQVSGDRAIAMAVEAQLDLRLPNFTLAFRPGESPTEVRPTAQFYTFYDNGRTFENLRTDPDRRVESFGGGVRTAFNETFFLDAEVVHRITRRVDAGGAAVRPLPATAGFVRAMIRF